MSTQWLWIKLLLSVMFFHVICITSNSISPNAEYVDRVYSRIIECMKKSVHVFDWDKLRYPSDAASHYADLVNKTVHLRQLPVHKAAGYGGPWIENLYVEKFLPKPLASFNGLIPLFVQFVIIVCIFRK